MFWKKDGTQVNIIEQVYTDRYFWCNEAVLIEVKNGKSVLISQTQSVGDAYYGNRYLSALTLNGKPLIQKDVPSCPTCAGLLATGYGIEKIDSAELKEISVKINAEFAGINKAVENIKPLLALLQSGMYLVADINAYPTDGNGHFFWDVPNKLTESPTTAYVLTEQYNCIGGIPVYLYPSQSTDSFNEDRVNYYKSRLVERDRFPRAIACSYGEFVNVLIDGHHKAAAAALCGVELPCLTIIPCSGISYNRVNSAKMGMDKIHFGDIQLGLSLFSKTQLTAIRQKIEATNREEVVTLENYNLINRDWDNIYVQSHTHYPDVFELAEAIALEIPEVSDEFIALCFSSIDEDSLRKLNYSILYFSRKDIERAKNVALRCAKLAIDSKLTETAFKVLSKIKNDLEIEQFFIDHLVYDQDKHSALRQIADNYWSD